MPSIDDQLARLRVAMVSGHLPPDLGQWLLRHIAERRPSADRRRERDVYLRLAVTSADGSSVWARAGYVLDVTSVMQRHPVFLRGQFDPGTCEWHVQRALQADPDRVPTTLRHLLNIVR